MRSVFFGKKKNQPKFKKLNLLVCSNIGIVAKYKIYFNIIMYIFLEFQMTLPKISYLAYTCNAFKKLFDDVDHGSFEYLLLL